MIENYIGGTIEDLLAIYEKYAERETNEVYYLPKWVIEEYRKATAYIVALINNPFDSTAIATLNHINAYIK